MKKRMLLAVIILVIATGSFFGGVWVSSRTEAPAQILEGLSVDVRPKPLDAMKIEELINQERAKAGLQPLAHSEKLKASACAKLDHMVENDYWAHTAPDGTEPWQFINNAGYRYRNAGENLAYSFYYEGEVIAGWMNSRTHKANIVGDYAEQAICAKIARYMGGYHSVIVSHFGFPY